MKPRHGKVTFCKRESQTFTFKDVQGIWSNIGSPNLQKRNLEPLSGSGALQVEPGGLGWPAERVGRARPARAGQPGRLVPPGRPVGCFARAGGSALFALFSATQTQVRSLELTPVLTRTEARG